MCLSADEVTPLCDECFAKEKLPQNFEPCEKCNESLKHFCGCCLVHRPDGVEDGCCKECREQVIE